MLRKTLITTLAATALTLTADAQPVPQQQVINQIDNLRLNDNVQRGGWNQLNIGNRRGPLGSLRNQRVAPNLKGFDGTITAATCIRQFEHALRVMNVSPTVDEMVLKTEHSPRDRGATWSSPMPSS